MDIKNVLNVLYMFESAASAYVMVRSATDNPCTDAEIIEAYENSEGTNDELTEQLLSQLDPTQLSTVVAWLRDSAQQLKEDDEDEYEELCLAVGTDIEQLLS